MNNPPTLWSGIVGQLQGELSEFSLEAWIRPLAIREEGDRLRLLAPSPFHKRRGGGPLPPPGCRAPGGRAGGARGEGGAGATERHQPALPGGPPGQWEVAPGASGHQRGKAEWNRAGPAHLGRILHLGASFLDPLWADQRIQASLPRAVRPAGGRGCPVLRGKERNPARAVPYHRAPPRRRCPHRPDRRQTPARHSEARWSPLLADVERHGGGARAPRRPASSQAPDRQGLWGGVG